jgi:hypothetical protein
VLKVDMAKFAVTPNFMRFCVFGNLGLDVRQKRRSGHFKRQNRHFLKRARGEKSSW